MFVKLCCDSFTDSLQFYVLQDGKRPFDFAMMNSHLSTAGRLVFASTRVEDLTVKVCDSQLC